MNIDGIGAIVFGGAHGVGSQIARHLADMGADVSIFDIDGAAAADVAAEFGGYSQHCDFRDETVVAACVTSAMSRYGQAARIIVNAVISETRAPLINSAGKVFIPIFNNAMMLNMLGLNTLVSYGTQAMLDMPVLDNGARGIIIGLVPAQDQLDHPNTVALSTTVQAAKAYLAAADRELSAFDIRCKSVEKSYQSDDLTSKAVISAIKNA